MKLTIIAATGGVGRQLLRQASDAGHDITAVARNPANVPQDVLAGRAVRIVAADLAAPDPQVLQDAVAGADAVLSALGPHNNAGAGIAAPGTRAITWRGWKTSCASPAWTGPSSARRNSPASRSPATTAPPWGGTCAAADRSPAPTSPTTCSPCSASLGPSAKSSASPANRHSRGVTQITEQGTTTRLPEWRLIYVSQDWARRYGTPMTS